MWQLLQTVLALACGEVIEHTVQCTALHVVFVVGQLAQMTFKDACCCEPGASTACKWHIASASDTALLNLQPLLGKGNPSCHELCELAFLHRVLHD